MRGRERREERREERQAFGARGGADRYQMREKMLSIGDDFWVEDESGRRAFKVEGKALRLRETLVIEDANGGELLKIQDRPVRVREVMEVEAAGGGTVATVKKAMISPLWERFTMDLAAGGEMTAQGNIVDDEFEIEGRGTKVAEVSKKWFWVRDSYGLEVASRAGRPADPGHSGLHRPVGRRLTTKPSRGDRATSRTPSKPAAARGNRHEPSRCCRLAHLLMQRRTFRL